MQKPYYEPVRLSRKNFNTLFLGYDLETGTAAECSQQHLVLFNGYFDL